MTVPAAPSPGRAAWLVLTYRLRDSHTLKITVRRRLTAIGAGIPGQCGRGLARVPRRGTGLPPPAAHDRRGRGLAQILRAEVIEGGADLAAAFNKAREQEYSEVIAGCGQVLAGIEALTAASQFRYPDLGGKDAELKRLSMRNDTIRARDVLGAANADLALSPWPGAAQWSMTSRWASTRRTAPLSPESSTGHGP